MATKGYGFTVDDIDWSSPADLEPYGKAYGMQIKHQDAQLHIMGLYAFSAVSVALDHFVSGKKAKSKYIEKPILSVTKTEEKEEISEEKRAEMENYKLAMSLRIMQANFEINRNKQI